jgi:hypothetical protein
MTATLAAAVVLVVAMQMKKTCRPQAVAHYPNLFWILLVRKALLL